MCPYMMFRRDRNYMVIEILSYGFMLRQLDGDQRELVILLVWTLYPVYLTVNRANMFVSCQTCWNKLCNMEFFRILCLPYLVGG